MAGIISRHSEINKFRSSELRKLFKSNNKNGYNNFLAQYHRRSFEDIIPSTGLIENAIEDSGSENFYD
ncbi:MAG: hypothetical protein Q8936_17435 [Bacillota bacterium]|nr:hypothetical protein [Bacillota bacterium]